MQRCAPTRPTLSDSSLDADQREDLLADILWAETSSQRASAATLAGRTRSQQAFAPHWVETLFLPETACRFDSRQDNFRCLTAAATHLWAQTGFGTWRQGEARFGDPDRALRLFHALETLRLDARIARHLPQEWAGWRNQPSRAGSGVSESLAIEAKRSGIHPIIIDNEGQDYLPHM